MSRFAGGAPGNAPTEGAGVYGGLLGMKADVQEFNGNVSTLAQQAVGGMIAANSVVPTARLEI